MAAAGDIICNSAKRLAAIAGLLTSLVAANVALAQPAPPSPPTIEPQRETRSMFILDVAGAEDTGAIFSAGGFAQISVFRQKVTRPPDCNVGICIENPRLFAHGLATLGVTHSGRFAAQSQLGLLYKTGHSIFPYAGLVAQYVHPVDRAGPAARIEVMDNLGLTAGWLFGERGNSFYVGVDIYHKVFENIGLF